MNRVLPADADGTFLARRRERQANYLAMIEDRFGGFRRWTVPLGEEDVIGV
nr:ArsA family ATPase [Gemmatimonadota bacterium]NIU80569.1 ArsA family ATPase [Gammaproteobacteria bacterium]NIX48886.1 ArsA family ATPase [Gemmatimonadota bacterium]NIY13330.1 ArsA family ATPase [Gemmatimonadota bacterium]